jgi:NAD+ kinase
MFYSADRPTCMSTPQASGSMPTQIAFVASKIETAQQALQNLIRRYGNAPMDKAEVIVALGGDGFMLQTLHRYKRHNLPVYGTKQGTVGFLMNLYNDDRLPERIAAALPTRLNPLKLTAIAESGATAEALAINEVSLLRQTKQAAKMRLWINDKIRVDELVCDGVMVATAAGSTAYNLSAHGPILPLSSEVLALTPISPFRPRRWRGAIIHRSSEVRIEILDHYKRPVSATADATEIRDVVEVHIREAPEDAYTVLFDAEHNLEERILTEQFAF